MDEKGWSITPILEPTEALKLSSIVKDEALRCVFNSVWDDVIIPMKSKGLNTAHLLTNNDLRKSYLPNPKMIWKNNNARFPYISKNCGMVNIYHQPLIREKILFNPDVINTIKEHYRHLPKATNDDRIVYMLGPDRVGFKPMGSTDMPFHLDSDLFNVTTGISKPVEHRIQSFMVLECPSGPRMDDCGGTKLLSGFHHYYDCARDFYQGQEVCLHPPYPVPFISKDHAKSFISYIESLYEDYSSSLRKYPNLPKKLYDMKWESPQMKPGELFCFDGRLPHRNNRNNYCTDRIVAYVSLFRRSDWISKGQPLLAPLFTGQSDTKHAGSNRRNQQERDLFKDVWTERVNFSLNNLIVRQVLGLD